MRAAVSAPPQGRGIHDDGAQLEDAARTAAASRTGDRPRIRALIQLFFDLVLVGGGYAVLQRLVSSPRIARVSHIHMHRDRRRLSRVQLQQQQGQGKREERRSGRRLEEAAEEVAVAPAGGAPEQGQVDGVASDEDFMLLGASGGAPSSSCLTSRGRTKECILCLLAWTAHRLGLCLLAM